MKKISSFCITIDGCDYVYDYDKKCFLSYWCDSPVDFDFNLLYELKKFGDKINFMIKLGRINI